MFRNYIFLLTYLFLFIPFQNFAQEDENVAQTVVHLLNYVSFDYAEAVKDGQIINDQEYDEQLEFAAHIIDLTRTSSFLPSPQKEILLKEMGLLLEKIKEKVADEEIAAIASRIKNEIIELADIATAPRFWPDLSSGKELYQSLDCISCHGEQGRGDGILAPGLEPPPGNFFDAELMDNFSPFQAFGSISLGVPGTGMRAYDNLTEEEIWDLAFYVKSLRFEDENSQNRQLSEEFNAVVSEFGLSGVANLTDQELKDSILALGYENAEKKLQALRTVTPGDGGLLNFLDLSKRELLLALSSYENGEANLARTHALDAYLEGIEPVESRLRAIDAGFVLQIENQMLNVRKAIEQKKPFTEVEEEVNQSIVLIEKAKQLLGEHKLDYWLTFILALSIMLREGLEAFLVLIVFISIIRSTGNRKAMNWMHSGWITALLVGVLSWFLTDYIISFGGKNRELMEGIISLVAVLVLLYVGFWMHSQTVSKKWQKLIKEKVSQYLERDKMYGLALFSFIVVFREVFEVILFLKAINLEVDVKNQSALGLGVIVSLLVIAVLAYFILKTTRKLPIRQLFLYSTLFIVLLAVILTGSGVHALQESGWIGVTQLPFGIRVEWLGIYPTLQSVGAQLFLILLIIGIYWFERRKAKLNSPNVG